MAISVKPNQSSADQAGTAAVMEKVERLSAERAKLRERWQANNAAWSDAVAAGRLFGAEVRLPSDIERPSPGGPPRHVARPEQKSLFESASAGEQTIREAVLDHLKSAGEKGIKASTLRRSIESLIGRQLHSKTIGMTLYRLSQKGQSRRDKLTWYYVPPGTK